MSDERPTQSDRAKKSGTPTTTQAGSVPGSSQSSNNENAYPRPDANQPSSLPAAIVESMGDPTGNKGREELLALAQDQEIVGIATMNRQELADALKARMAPEDLEAALTA